MFARRVAIVGTGFRGGRWGLRLRRALPGLDVVGSDRAATALTAARDRAAVSRVEPAPEVAVEGCDLVVLAAPVDETPGLCRRLAGAVPAECVVTDVGSAKATVVEAGESAFGERFVGGHPMAGSERHGIEAADELLFEDAWWILTPTEATSSEAYATVGAMATALGARTVALDPAQHDALVARLSHVPQLTASALVEAAVEAGDRDALLGLAGPGFRDVTRIAASSPDLWVAILRANRAPILDALGGLEGRLAEIAGMVRSGRWDDVAEFLARARSARLEMFAKPSLGAEPVALTMLVPDRPGVLAEVTTAAGALGANIEDLRIIHSTEGGRGRLELIVGGKSAAEGLVAELVALGYHVDRGVVG